MSVLGDYVCFYDDKKRITGHFGVQIDVTDQKKAEEKLRESEEQLRLTLEATGEGIWDWDIVNDSINHNTRWYEILGIEEETHDHSVEFFLECIYEDDRASVLERVNSC